MYSCCRVSFPPGAPGWSVVSYYGISSSYLFSLNAWDL